MSEMILRVAMAIKASVPEGYGMTAAEAIVYAKVAIQEMRSPTKTMEDAGYTHTAFPEGKWPGSLSYRPDYIYQAMIDDALGREPA